MKATQFNRKEPAKSRGFSWARVPMAEGGPVCYRLFRRDYRGALHMSALVLEPCAPRDVFAAQLRAACHGLRDKVDMIDLQAMEEAA